MYFIFAGAEDAVLLLLNDVKGKSVILNFILYIFCLHGRFSSLSCNLPAEQDDEQEKHW